MCPSSGNLTSMLLRRKEAFSSVNILSIFTQVFYHIQPTYSIINT